MRKEETAFGTPLAAALLFEKEHEALEDDRAVAEDENVEVVAIFLFNLCMYPSGFFNEKLSGKIVRYAKRRRTTTTLKRDEEIPPFFLSSAVPRRFTAVSKRRAHERGFENRGGVFRVSRRGGEFFVFVFLSM
jgi:hypothetical protein